MFFHTFKLIKLGALLCLVPHLIKLGALLCLQAIVEWLYDDAPPVPRGRNLPPTDGKASPSQTHNIATLFQNGAKIWKLRCVLLSDPSTCRWKRGQTCLKSSIQHFNPHFICGTQGHPRVPATGKEGARAALCLPARGCGGADVRGREDLRKQDLPIRTQRQLSRRHLAEYYGFIFY